MRSVIAVVTDGTVQVVYNSHTRPVVICHHCCERTSSPAVSFCCFAHFSARVAQIPTAMVTVEQLEVEQLRQANQKLLADLAHERSLRHTAEEEQLRTEQELSALMLELRAAQRQAGQGGGDGLAAPQLQADLETLLAELDRERAQSAQLATAVQTAQAEMHALRQRLQQAEQLHGGGGLRPVGSSASMAEAGGDAAGLAQRVASLKAARDKLIAALDLQAAEVERLSAENAALTEVCAREHPLPGPDRPLAPMASVHPRRRLC